MHGHCVARETFSVLGIEEKMSTPIQEGEREET